MLRYSSFLPATAIVLLFLLIVHQGLVGMSMENDGLIYASIAKHLALGQGSFWFPYSPLDETSFHHHPPLAFWLQSLFFRVFGDAFWVENLYQVSCLGLALWCLRGVANLSLGPGRTWLVFLTFLSAPVVAFVFTDNFLEVTLTLMTVAAVYCQLLAFTRNGIRSDIWMIAAGLLTICAFLTKGPVGLFPLVVPLVFTLMLREANHEQMQQSLRLFGLYGLGLLLGIASIMLSEDGRASLEHYMTFQWLGTAEGERPMLHGRLYMLEQLARNLLLPGIITGALCWRYRGVRFDERTIGWLVIALCASLPLLISPRQFKWYFAPALPFYALFLTALVPFPNRKTSPLIPSRKQDMVLLILVIGLTLGVIWQGFTKFGSLDNDYEAIHDLRIVQKRLPEGTEVGLCATSVAAKTGAHDRYFMYLSRYHSVKVLPDTSREYVFCASDVDLPVGYEPLDEPLKLLSIYSH